MAEVVLLEVAGLLVEAEVVEPVVGVVGPPPGVDQGRGRRVVPVVVDRARLGRPRHRRVVQVRRGVVAGQARSTARDPAVGRPRGRGRDRGEDVLGGVELLRLRVGYLGVEVAGLGIDRGVDAVEQRAVDGVDQDAVRGRHRRLGHADLPGQPDPVRFGEDHEPRLRRRPETDILEERSPIAAFLRLNDLAVGLDLRVDVRQRDEERVRGSESRGHADVDLAVEPRADRAHGALRVEVDVRPPTEHLEPAGELRHVDVPPATRSGDHTRQEQLIQVDRLEPVQRPVPGQEGARDLLGLTDCWR